MSGTHMLLLVSCHRESQIRSMQIQRGMRHIIAATSFGSHINSGMYTMHARCTKLIKNHNERAVISICSMLCVVSCHGSSQGRRPEGEVCTEAEAEMDTGSKTETEAEWTRSGSRNRRGLSRLEDGQKKNGKENLNLV